ncbi:helix-turn-helix transcriptional regulator [Konateibacter massiliensis]|uniref:helix-turn-helix transcriptional regulator n=1 Tax=Konateibacter massiliensis TaxID=2002841 RepID=UPI000C15D144|nr:AraC family transcriptional regulator [Konateibacter massiliensis]
MNETEIYTLGWGALAKEHRLATRPIGNGLIYHFPPSWEQGWIHEMHPAEGVFTASAWFTPTKQIRHKINVSKPAMWIFCIDCGDITISQQGKLPQKLTPMTHVIINPQKPFSFVFPKGVHACFTSVLIFEDFIEKVLQGRENAPIFHVEDAVNWKSQHYNTPYIMLILEQIRWAVRNADFPLLGLESMVTLLLSAIAQNYPEEPIRRRSRVHYVNWENEQKIYKVKVALDNDILNAPGITEMCKLAQMSESKLRNSFRNLYGVSLYDYIRIEKMKRAMQLLGADHLSIHNIAEQCGYQNQSKFTSAFKAVHGITPSEFRKAFNL